MDGSPPEKHPVFRRNSSFGSSASLSSSSSSSSSSPSSSIPFSWEHLPGIPKTSTTPKTNPGPLLPLPPPLRPNSSDTIHRKKRTEERFLVDPFAVALAECAKEQRTSDVGDELEEFWRKGAAKEAAMRRRRVAAPAFGDWFGIVDLYGSCKATCSVVDSTVCIPRSGRSGSYSLLSRRAG